MKKLFISLSILILLSFPVHTVAQTPSSIQIYFFYAEDCQSCQVILQSYLPTLKTMFSTLEVKTFDVGNPAHYEALAKLENKFGRTGNELPIVFVGDQMLSGEMEIMEKLNPLLLEVQAKGSSSLLLLKSHPWPNLLKKALQWILPIFIRRDVQNVIGQTSFSNIWPRGIPS